MKEIIKYNNDMNTVAFRKFSAVELDLLMVICSRMKNQSIDSVKFKFSDLKSLINYSSTTSINFVNALDSTYQKLIETHIKIGDDKLWTRFVLFTEYTINTYEQTVNIGVNKKFQYILNELTSNFTRFELQEFVNLNSSYSKECYRHLKQFKTTGKWIVNIDEFKRLLAIPDSYKMCDIDKTVLNPIKNELTPLFQNLKITKIKKKGRGRGGQVKAFEFSFSPEKVYSAKIEKPSVFNSKPKSLTTSTTTTNSTFNKFHNFDTPKSEKYSEEYLNALLKNPNKK